MQLNINATGMSATPIQEGVHQTDELSKLDVTIFFGGSSYSPTQLDHFLDSIATTANYDWLKRSGNKWSINSQLLCKRFTNLEKITWLKGILVSDYVTEFGSLHGPMGHFEGGHGLSIIGNHSFAALTFSLNPEVAADSNSVFYSWMSDHDNFSNRGFIQDCLEQALKRLRKEEGIGITPSLDKDTKGESGSVDIANTIFRKIERARVFVADVTLVTRPLVGWQNWVAGRIGLFPKRISPNPNVLIELGYAASQLGWDKCLLVVNTAYGSVEQLPFDLRGRRVIPYHVFQREERTAAKESLVAFLKRELGTAMELETR